MRKRLSVIGIIVTLTTLLLITGCSGSTSTTSSTTTPSSTSTATRPSSSSSTITTGTSVVEDVQAYADPIVQGMLTAFSNGDYNSFTKYMDQTTKNIISASDFSQQHDQITKTIGNYESSLFFSYTIQGNNTIVTYISQYSEEPAGVIVTVSFPAGNSAHEVNGFHLASPRLEGQSVDVPQIREYADPATENILTSLNNDDYASFSKDFDQTVKSKLNDTAFKQLYDQIKTAAGTYGSKEFESISVQSNVTTVLYLAQFTNEPAGVWIVISFDTNQQIAGLIFDSPKINGK